MKNKGIIYDRGTIKVVMVACLMIVVAVVCTGIISYLITRTAVVKKLKFYDLPHTTEVIATKIDARIERAKETSLLLAHDQTMIDWLTGAEKDDYLGELVKKKITDIARNYDYTCAFIANRITNHYWSEGANLTPVVADKSYNIAWFHKALASGQQTQINIEYDKGRRKQTMVFINARVGGKQQPIAVAGVGLDLQKMTQEFQRYKWGQKSQLWMIDGKGQIYLSDALRYNGKNLNRFIPKMVVDQILHDRDRAALPKSIEYLDAQGEKIDLAYRTMKSTDWILVFQIPRSESIAMLNSIKINTITTGLVTLVLMIFVFYLISHHIADPLKRALLLTKEMERQVTQRTQELAEKTQEIMDSIDYAKRLQEAILPSRAELALILDKFFVLWQPRDIVGGDFYWARRIDADKSLLALIDCSGHGVPGAFMTMAVNAILNDIVEKETLEPAVILEKLNVRIKETLHRHDQGEIVDDGLDIAICQIDGKKRLLFAGAKLALYIQRGSQIELLKGDKWSIGYRRSPLDLTFTTHCWEIEAGDRFYLTTDGYIEQNGGEKDFSFGKKRFIQGIVAQRENAIDMQREAFEVLLNSYKGNETQRDDITIVGFSLK